MKLLHLALGSILYGLLADEPFALAPWLTRMIVRLTARSGK